MTMLASVRGELRYNEPMAGHVSWRAGGSTDVWFRPADIADLQAFLKAYDGPVLPVGLGSNLLVRDGGWPGAVISLYDALSSIEFGEDGQVMVGAGVHCATLATQAARQGFAGATFFGGIPGSIGGALAMNAGAWGGETWKVVRRVQALRSQGEVGEWDAEAFTAGYRQVEMPEPGLIFLAAELQLEPAADSQALQAELRAMIAERKARQPVGQPSCGSVFRNPPNGHAAALIEEAGLKGFRMGEAEVAEKHANFILNRGSATAADIEALINHVRTTVKSRSGVELVPEVRIVGVAA